MSDTKDKYPLLSSIEYPSDLRELDKSQLPALCSELRSFIVDALSRNPGHLASSLGAVELTVALHYVFDTPTDKLVWDVGHQAYAHKILTGRKDVFETIRHFHGLSGFPSPKESGYDTFVAGHASNSISAALGMAVAGKLENKRDKVVAVIGDGAMTGGLAFEGLNNVCVNPNNLLIVLNDNNMSIDMPVGGMSKYLTDITTSRFYNDFRFKSYHLLRKIGLMNDSKKNKLMRMGTSIKNNVSGSHNIFEGLNIRYFGQVDGHDVLQLVKVLNDIKDFEGPRVLHIKTVKGKGYEPAEKDAIVWHAPGLFVPETGERIKSDKSGLVRYQDVFGQTLLDLAERNEKIIGITPAMPTGCSMNIMAEKMPNRVFDVGIAEGHAVTFSAGLAKEGLMPFCNIYSSFMQRAYDNVIHDVALQKLNMVICLDRAGLVGQDGPTHHGAFDIAYMRPIPNLTIASPLNERELRDLLYTAQLPDKGPFVIRYPRGKGVGAEWRDAEMKEIKIGKGVTLKEGTDIAVLTFGPLGNEAANAIDELDEKERGKVGLYNMRFVKPIDTQLLDEISLRYKKILTVEDGVRTGGFGSAVLEYLSDKGCAIPVIRLGLPDSFIEHGTPAELYKLTGLDKDAIKESICQNLK
ncbi:MAG: 1-deoxy-D-xylulose-5-phosphate synthase [Paludibacteraceae bacterium]|nr:1-deoxy-D-xylulose-5-phosphate synthase [Paludibacteraceae bacterium]